MRLLRLALLLALCAAFTSLAAAQTTERVLLSDFATASVHGVNAADGSVAGSTLVGASPTDAVVLPNHRTAFVCNINSGYVSVIDLPLQREFARIDGVHCRTLAVTPDGREVVAETFDSDAAILDVASLQVTHRVDLHSVLGSGFADPRGVAIAGGAAYFQFRSSTIYPLIKVDLTDCAAPTWTCAVSTVPGTALGRTFNSSFPIVATPDGRFLVATRGQPFSGRAIFILDTTTNALTKIVPPVRPGAIAVSSTATPDGSFAYFVSDFDPNNIGGPLGVRRLDLRPTVAGNPNPNFGAIEGDVQLPWNSSLHGIAVSGDGTRVYATVNTDAFPNFVTLDATQVVSSPSTAILAQAQVGHQVVGAVIADVDTSGSGAPVVSSVDSNQTINGVKQPSGVLVNSDPSNVLVGGTGFSADAQVRIGTAGSLQPSAFGSTLTVPVPAQVPAGTAAVLVTDFNTTSAVTDWFQTGLFGGPFVIAPPALFQPANEALSCNFGAGTISILNVATNASVQRVQDALNCLGIALLPDGSHGYMVRFIYNDVVPFDLSTGTVGAPIALSGSTGQGNAIIVAPYPPLSTPTVPHYVAYVVSQLTTPTFDSDSQLNVVDVQPGSPTVNTILATIPANLVDAPDIARGGLTATPDGRFVYSWDDTTDGSQPTRLIVFDTLTGTATPLDGATLGVTFQWQPAATADTLALASPGGVQLFDISGANATAPVPLALLAGTPPALPGAFRIQGNRLYAFDNLNDVIQAFNFDRVGGNFAYLGRAVIPGPANGNGTIDVTPDGSLLYAGLSNQDAVAVLDALKVQTSAPDALLTKLATDIGPNPVIVRPGSPVAASAAPGDVVTVQPLPEVSVSLTDSSGGTVSVAATSTTAVSTPAGFQVGPVPVYYEISSTATFTSAVVCFTYDPTGLTATQEANLGVAHFNGTSWDDVTVPGSLNTTTHTVCAQVSHFSPFVIGIRTTNFLFDTLVQNITQLSTPVGVMRSLRAKALAARASFNRQDSVSAVGQLTALQNQLAALSGVQVSATDAGSLSTEAAQIVSRLQP